MSSTNSPQLITLNKARDKKFLVCIFFKTSHCFIIKVVTFLMVSMRAADLSHLRESSFHFRVSGSLRPRLSLNLSSGQCIHLVEKPSVWKNEVGCRKCRPNKCFSVNGRFGAFANIMAYSGYHGETEGSADEAKEWPAGSGFSHLWGTAQVLHSSSCQLPGGCLPTNSPEMKGAALPKICTSFGLPASNTDRYLVTKTRSPCLSMRHLWRASPASELPLGLAEASLSAPSHFHRHPLLRSTSFARVQVLIQESLEIHMQISEPLSWGEQSMPLSQCVAVLSPFGKNPVL